MLLRLALDRITSASSSAEAMGSATLVSSASLLSSVVVAIRGAFEKLGVLPVRFRESLYFRLCFEGGGDVVNVGIGED